MSTQAVQTGHAVGEVLTPEQRRRREEEELAIAASYDAVQEANRLDRIARAEVEARGALRKQYIAERLAARWK